MICESASMSRKLNILKYSLILSLLPITIAILHQLYDAFADRQTFASSSFSGPGYNWFYKMTPPLIVGFKHIKTSYGTLYYDRLPISRSECTLGSQSDFPYPGINSISYSSDGKNLNSILWLTGPLKDTPLKEKERLQSPSVNNLNLTQVQYNVSVHPTGNFTLNSTKDIISRDFTIDDSTQITLAGLGPAYNITYDRPVGEHKQQFLQILAVKGNKLYNITYGGDEKRYHEFLPDSDSHTVTGAQAMINSIKFTTTENKSISNEGGNKTYENDEYRIKMQYPYNWTGPFKPTGTIGYFYSPDNTSHIEISSKDTQPGQDVTLNEYMNKQIAMNRESQPFFNLIESNSATLLSGQPAYAFVYSFYYNNTSYKVREIGTKIGDDKVITLRYYSKLQNYDRNWPTIKKNAIDTFHVNIPLLTYQNDKMGIKMQYPYNWAKKENESGNNENVTFVSPISGPYLISKAYSIGIVYKTPYGVQLHYMIEGSWDSTNRTHTWVRKVIETGAGEELISRDLNYTGFYFNATKNSRYVLLNFNLNDLNLPNQFYILYLAQDIFLKDGKYCTLSESVPPVTFPPLDFSIKMTPSSLINLRPEDEKDIQIEANSSIDLPFRLSLSTHDQINQRNLEITFNPNNTAGVIGGLAASNLHIKVLKNATTRTYSIPINATIVPSEEIAAPAFTNQSATTINRISYFTLSVLPALTWQERIANTWNSLGSPINGFIGLITAIGGGIGGWFIKHMRSKGDNDVKNKYKNFQEGW